MIQSNRRAFLSGFAAIIAAPAIVRASSLMPIKPLEARFINVQVGLGYAFTRKAISQQHMRDLLMPGLNNLMLKSYDTIPSQWHMVFEERHAHSI